jgi:hypothetical protein
MDLASQERTANLVQQIVEKDSRRLVELIAAFSHEQYASERRTGVRVRLMTGFRLGAPSASNRVISATAFGLYRDKRAQSSLGVELKRLHPKPLAR